jgi:hypothetical protein
MATNYETYRKVKANPYLKECPIPDKNDVKTQHQQVSLGIGAKKIAEGVTMLASVQHPPSDHLVVENIHVRSRPNVKEDSIIVNQSFSIGQMVEG